MKELMSLKGTDGTIIAYDDRVVISRQGLTAISAHGFKGDKTFFYTDLTSIEYKKPGMTNGYIHFVVPGASSHSPKVNLIGTSQNTLSDENTVTFRAFNKNVPSESEELYNILLEQIQKAKSTNNLSNNNFQSGADEILKYKSLLDSGIITQDEFNAKKKQILGL